jgi:hypothetical protein
VWFVIANYFAVRDLSVFRDVCEFDEETCIGAWNISNSLKKLPHSFPKSVISFGAEEAWEKLTLDGTIRRGMGVERPWEARLDRREFVLFVI